MRVASIDQGTTSTRCLVVEDKGQWNFIGSRTHRQIYPAPGWNEHDPEELLANICWLLRSAGVVDGVALANQGESCLAWDAHTGRPLSNVIVWQDSRSREHLQAIPEEDALVSKRICGLPLDPYFSASKLGWLLRNVPAVEDAHAKGRLRLGTTDSFFIDRLCNRFVTDHATASRTGLLDIDAGCWSPDLCELHGIPIDCLPEIVPVDGSFGEIFGTPLLASTVDQQAALYGHGARDVGDCKITFGTGAFLLAITGAERPQTCNLIPTIAWKKSGSSPTFAVEAGVYDAGSAVEWCRSLGLFGNMDEISLFDGPTAISRGIVFVPALSGLGAPHWDRGAAPIFIGMDHSTSRRDLTRAVLEGVAMLTASLIEEAARIVPIGNSISIDGGLSQSAYFARFLASACRRTIAIPPMHELTALGLADLCGIDVREARRGGAWFAPDDTVTPANHAHFAEALRRASAWRPSKSV
jgi:glycerol kinase